MAMDDHPPLTHRGQQIAALIASELDRQVQHGSANVQVEALAAAIDQGLGGADPVAPLDEGRHPDELNSANDG